MACPAELRGAARTASWLHQGYPLPYLHRAALLPPPLGQRGRYREAASQGEGEVGLGEGKKRRLEPRGKR